MHKDYDHLIVILGAAMLIYFVFIWILVQFLTNRWSNKRWESVGSQVPDLIDNRKK